MPEFSKSERSRRVNSLPLSDLEHQYNSPALDGHALTRMLDRILLQSIMRAVSCLGTRNATERTNSAVDSCCASCSYSRTQILVMDGAISL